MIEVVTGVVFDAAEVEKDFSKMILIRVMSKFVKVTQKISLLQCSNRQVT